VIDDDVRPLPVDDFRKMSFNAKAQGREDLNNFAPLRLCVKFYGPQDMNYAISECHQIVTRISLARSHLTVIL